MKKHPTVVIKLGTSSIVDESTHQPLLSVLAVIVETAVGLRKNGCKVVIVSSGAIGVALRQMDLPRRPKHLPQVQALAAIGQCRLIGLWDQLFDRLDQTIAQILLTRNDIADRTQYLNAQNTFIELLHMGVIPIVNENDTLAVTEIKFGDNDTLSAITAGMVQADYLFLMTDVDCLYDKNPRRYPDAKPIEVVEDISNLAADVSSSGSALGTGGMWTKIVAARLATSAGVTTIITKSSKPGNIAAIVDHLEAKKLSQIPRHLQSTATPDSNSTSPGINTPTSTATGSNTPASTQSRQTSVPPLHTRFLPSSQPIRDRRFWLLHGLAPHGTVYIDHGAASALADKAGLLPVGVVDVEGSFAQQECVRLVDIGRRPNTNRHSNTPREHQLGQRPTLPSSHASSPSLTTVATGAASAHHRRQSSGVALNASADSGTRTPPPHTSAGGNNGGLSHPPTPPAVSAAAEYPGAREIGRALVNYSASEIKRIAGLRSSDISAALGYADSEYVALRENVALTAVVDGKGGGTVSSSSSGWEDGMAHLSFEDSASEVKPKARLGLGGYVEG